MPMEEIAMAAAPEIVEPEELGAGEFRDLLEQRVRERFGVTLDRFVKALRAGELNEEPAATEFAMLIGARPGED
jgi:hypothetical protein